MAQTSNTNIFLWNLIYLCFCPKPKFNYSLWHKKQHQRIPLSGSTQEALGPSQQTQQESSCLGRMSWKCSHTSKNWVLHPKTAFFHGMREHLRLAGTSGDHLIQPSAHGRPIQSRWIRIVSGRSLDISRDGDSMSSPNYPWTFQHFLHGWITEKNSHLGLQSIWKNF